MLRHPCLQLIGGDHTSMPWLLKFWIHLTVADICGINSRRQTCIFVIRTSAVETSQSAGNWKSIKACLPVQVPEPV